MRPQYFALAANEVRVVPLDYDNDGFLVTVQAPGATVELTLDNIWTQPAGQVVWSPAPAAVNGIIVTSRVCSALRLTNGGAASKAIVLQAERLHHGASAAAAPPTDDQLADALFAAWPGPKLWYDMLPAANRMQNTNGTTPAAAANDPVGYVKDRAGSNIALIAPGTTARPLLGTDGTRYYASADGVNDAFQTSAPLDLTAYDKVTLIIAVRKRNSDGTYMLTEFGPDFTVGGSFGMYSGQAAPQAYWNFGISGAQNNPTPITASPNIDTAVMVGQGDFANANGFSVQLTRNSDATVQDATVAGARKYLNAIINVLSRNGTGLFFPGDLYSYMLLAGAYPTAAQMDLLKRVSASRMGL